jgi:transcription elongation GreA/GreB family factor
MSEKPEAEDFNEDLEEPTIVSEEVDLDRVSKELESARRRAAKGGGTPAWRRLELLAEQKRTAELTSDFNDYDLGERPSRAAKAAHR